MAALTKPTVKINNVTYEDVPSLSIKGILDSTSTTYDDLDFYWTGDASVVEGTGADAGTTAQVLTGVTVYGPNGKLTGNMTAQTGDYTTDGISATSSIVKLSVPSTNYYSTNANITATFKGSNSILAAWDTQNSTAYNTDGSNLTVNAKTGFTIPNGYYQGKTASVTAGAGTSNWTVGTNNYVSDSSTSSYSFSITPSVTISTAGWIAQGDIVAGEGASRMVYVNPGQVSATATVTDNDSALIDSSAYSTPEIVITPVGTSATAGWVTSNEISTGSATSKYIKPGSATPSMSWAASSDDYFLSSGTNDYSIQVTPTAAVGTAGWISSISNGAAVTKYLKEGNVSLNVSRGTGASTYLSDTSTAYSFRVVTVARGDNAGWIPSGSLAGSDDDYYLNVGSASAGATIGDASSALTGSSTDNTPTVTVTPTRTVTTSGWMTSSEITTNAVQTKYIKAGSVTLSAARTGGTAQVDNNGTYTVVVSASGTTTAGWVSSNPTTATATVKIKDAGITTFDQLSGNAGTHTSSTNLTINLSRLVSGTPTAYEGYVNGGSATVTYGIIASAPNTSSIAGSNNYSISGVSGHILADTSIFGVTGTIAIKAASDVTYTANTSTAVTIPAGYYAEQVTKNVPSVTQDGTTNVLTIS